MHVNVVKCAERAGLGGPVPRVGGEGDPVDKTGLPSVCPD